MRGIVAGKIRVARREEETEGGGGEADKGERERERVGVIQPLSTTTDLYSHGTPTYHDIVTRSAVTAAGIAWACSGVMILLKLLSCSSSRAISAGSDRPNNSPHRRGMSWHGIDEVAAVRAERGGVSSAQRSAALP